MRTETNLSTGRVTVHEDAPARVFTQDELDAQAAQITKAAKVKALLNITVTTTNGNTFDGDEVSQGRMARALMVAGTLNRTTTGWKMANNTTVVIDVPELTEALALSMEAVEGIILS